MSERVMLSTLTPPANTQLSPEEVLGFGEELLDHFGVEVSTTDQPDDFVEAMDQINPRNQGERTLVRFELEQDQTKWSDETIGIVMRAAEGMRMLAPQTPLEGD